MSKTIEQIKVENLAMEIQEFTCDHPECNNMTVEDFVFHLLDYHKSEI